MAETRRVAMYLAVPVSSAVTVVRNVDKEGKGWFFCRNIAWHNTSEYTHVS